MTRIVKKFEKVAANERHDKWELLVRRESGPFIREGDELRTEFEHDYTRILHSTAYRRLKHKTQVFFNVDNDHVCTRMEHVSHVESVASTITKALGLNEQLTKAIAMGHDLGHAPFGHCGESILNKLKYSKLNDNFWHEYNGLYFVDKIELLPNKNDVLENLNLTYAVRDGIISHCGEVDEKSIRPRQSGEDLYRFGKGDAPFTWEACVVKFSDKIAYLGRDIEDARMLKILSDNEKKELEKISGGLVNTTAIIGKVIHDVVENSSIDKGICMGDEIFGKLRLIKDFCVCHIYESPFMKYYKNYVNTVIDSIYELLMDTYDYNDNKPNWEKIQSLMLHYPTLLKGFVRWLVYYSDKDMIYCDKTLSAYRERLFKLNNTKLYGMLDNEVLYKRSIIDFISGMTDRFAVQSYDEMLRF